MQVASALQPPLLVAHSLTSAVAAALVWVGPTHPGLAWHAAEQGSGQVPPPCSQPMPHRPCCWLTRLGMQPAAQHSRHATRAHTPVQE